MVALALREDRYFVAGQAIAGSLVRGSFPLGFIAPTLYSCLDADLYEKVKKVNTLYDGSTLLKLL